MTIALGRHGGRAAPFFSGSTAWLRPARYTGAGELVAEGLGRAA
ncbi:MAG: hypothetical protein AAF698_02310 [Pseudomonadota bacterium]